jgi:hypothetical protein
LTGLISVIVVYGAIVATVIGILGPVFIPWMVFDKTDFLFWGWLKAFLGFEFYKVVAAATMSVMSHLLINLWGDFDPGEKTLSVRRSAVDGHVADVKSDASRDVIPLSGDFISFLLRWHRIAPSF